MKINKSINLPLDKFIEWALYDKNSGYYMKKNPFGKEGAIGKLVGAFYVSMGGSIACGDLGVFVIGVSDNERAIILIVSRDHIAFEFFLRLSQSRGQFLARWGDVCALTGISLHVEKIALMIEAMCLGS